MPYLRFKGFQDQALERVAPVIVEEFAYIVNVPEEKVKIELLQVQQITNSPLSVEILMFQREQEMHHAVAAKINDILVEAGFPGVHIFFVILSPQLYYKEGKPLTILSAPDTR